MNTRIRDVLFLFMSFSLIFNMLPVWLHIPFISGTMHGHMLIYPAIIGVIYTFYCEYKGMHVFEHRITVLKYLSIFFIINLASLLIGFYKFPYWHYFMTGPVSQIEKLPLVLEWCKNIGIILNQEHIVVFWFALRQIKMVFCDALYAFGFSYLIYCWYRNDWKQGFNIFCRGVIASIIFVGIYCVIEVWFLSGSEIAKNVLVTINPYIHAIKIIKDLWPPLLSWPHQLRAVFPEPSHMGNYAAYALPVLWYWLFKVKEKHNVLFFSVLCFYFSFLILLSKARTATAIYFGLIFLLLIGIFFVLPTRKYLCKISA